MSINRFFNLSFFFYDYANTSSNRKANTLSQRKLHNRQTHRYAVRTLLLLAHALQKCFKNHREPSINDCSFAISLYQSHKLTRKDYSRRRFKAIDRSLTRFLFFLLKKKKEKKNCLRKIKQLNSIYLLSMREAHRKYFSSRLLHSTAKKNLDKKISISRLLNARQCLFLDLFNFANFD